MGDQQQQQQPHQHQQHAPYALPPPTSSIMYGAAAGQGHTGSTHSPQAQSHAQFYAHSHQQQPEQSSPCGGGGGGGGSTSGTTPQQQQQQAYQQQQLYAQQQYHQEQSSHNSSMDDVSGGPSGGSGGGAAGGGSESIGGASAKKSSNTTTSTSAVKDKDKDKEQDKDDGKFSRSKGACQQCRAVKQRCSGAAKHPCERCQLYKLECIFSKDPPPQKESGPSSRTMKKAAMKQASSDPETGAAVLQSLRVITERLRTIEESLALQQRAGSAGPQASTSGQNGYGSYPSSATSQSYGFDGDVKRPLYDGPALTSVGGGEVADPITTVTSAIKGLDQAMAAASPFAGGSQAGTPDGSSPQQHVNGNGANAVGANFEPDVPDAVSRGFVTVEEAQQLFDFYFSRCAHWTPPLDVHNDRNMHHVRRRSTFLFHAILSVASYFCYVPQGENGLRKYYAIVTTLVESLAPIVVSPNPAELTVDLLMGLLLCIQWKPVRCGSQMQLGPAGFSKLQAQSKLNPSSGYVLGGLALRISQLLGLARRASHPNPANRQSIQACRLWLWINLVDSQGALAEGKSPALDPSDALRVTRLFASIRSKPGDVRLAAMAELYAAVVPIVAAHHGASKTDFRALYRANAVLDRITVYWAPHIEDAYGSGDALAATFLNVFVPFVRVVLNADVFRTWLIRRKAESKGGEIDLETARHTLTSEEAHCIGFAVSAAEEMLYYLSTASRAEGAARKHAWAPRDMQTGHRPSLYLDSELARLLSSSVDSILLVIYAFPPLFLAQLRAQNIINCDLDMAPEITNDLFSVGFPSRALLPASKFMRLLEVSAEFYEATSPNKDFPAIPQAQLLRTMACLSAPVGISTSLPNFSNGELSFLDGSGLRGASEGGTAPACGIDMGAAAKAYQYQMQQISAHAPPTNTDLPYPYNTMVFSTEGADRLDAIMQQSVPDPLSGTSLLGSFAKIDADWNAYFNPAQNVPGAQQQQQPQQHAQQDIYASLAQTQHIRNSPDSVHSHVGASPQQQQQQYYAQQQPLPGMGNYHPQQQQQMVPAPILNSHAGRSY